MLTTIVFGIALLLSIILVLLIMDFYDLPQSTNVKVLLTTVILLTVISWSALYYLSH